VVEELARRRGVSLDLEECRTRLAVDGDLVLATPETFMNRSGYAARCLVESHGVEPARILVVYDDFALPLGALRLRLRGGPGGQRGMASVLECLRTDDVPRLRLGVAPVAGLGPEIDRVELVLTRFAPEEMDAAREQVQRGADACELWLEAGAEAVMNRYNRSDGPTESDAP
jgi:PTH1 family peptidyl-tRNA hydrolase